MSKQLKMAKLSLSLVVGTGLLAPTCLVAAQDTAPAANKAPYMDARIKEEIAAGAPALGAPIPKGTPRGPGSLRGVWYPAGTGGADHTVDGDPIPMMPWVKAAMDKRASDAKAGHPYAGSKSRCLPAGLPQEMTGPKTLGLRIIEEPKIVTVLIEEMTNFRQIFLDAKHSPDAIPSYQGDSVGHWEGDTLVVESTTFNPDVDVGGRPHSPEARTIERMRRIAPDWIEYYITIDDPKAYTKPWTMPRRTLKREPWNIYEYICTNQRNGTDETGNTGLQLESPHQ